MGGNNTIRLVILLLTLLAGILIGISHDSAMKDSGFLIFLGLLIFFSFIVIYGLTRLFIVRERKKLKGPEGAKVESEVGFVVDTFHELVGKLKEKEKELARLKSQAEEKAVGFEAYNENILRSVPSGVVTVDTALEIRSINSAAERILGIREKDFLNKSLALLFGESLIKSMRENENVSRGEYPYVTSDGRHIWIGATTSQLLNAAGEVIGTIFIFSDLTDIKALRTQMELKERLSQLGEMSAGISHEIRNSMSVISGYAKLMKRKLAPSESPPVDAILSEIKSMDNIISELLSFAKPSVLHREDVNFGEIIRDTVSSITHASTNITVAVRANALVSVRADEVLLRQALTNLVKNSVESMPEGGNLDIDLSTTDTSAVLLVKDSGCGIPEETREKIFLPFYTTKESGAGLGLALVQKIIVSHNGSIEVESSEGRGTTFKILLPLAS
jgi:PAS domain S-box-containing protein